MIDTDKYEGHTEGLWFDGEPTEISNTISNAFFQLNPNEIGKANARLAIDAPLLLAEIKRLREENDMLSEAVKEDNKILKKHIETLAEVKRLRRHLEDVVDELATHLGDYEDEMYDWIRKMHKLYGSD